MEASITLWQKEHLRRDFKLVYVAEQQIRNQNLFEKVLSTIRQYRPTHESHIITFNELTSRIVVFFYFAILQTPFVLCIYTCYQIDKIAGVIYFKMTKILYISTIYFECTDVMCASII